jgi:trehalose 6-phosphate phosphatase
MTENEIASLTRLAANARVLRLFLDYDGTLAEFAPSPDVVIPEKEILSILERLVATRGIYPAVISGRRLANIQKLLPVHGLLLGGTYGIEMQLPDGQYHTTYPFEQVRPTVEHLLPRWQALVEERKGFYLEDKGWALAIHGRLAQKDEAERVLTAAYEEAQDLLLDARFRLLKGDRFLEFAPCAANKSQAVRWVIKALTPKHATVIYIGDDDKDEEAFSVVLASGGFAVRVTTDPIKTRAQFLLSKPSQVRAWLTQLLAIREA